MTAPLLFTPEIDWSDPFVEEREYETAIFVAYDDTETREGLRDAPNRRFSYTVPSDDLRQSGLLHALIHAGQGVVCWVPYWRKARYLTADVASGATSLAIANPASRGFVVGEGAMFWRDWHTAEAVTIAAMTDTTLVFSPTDRAWNGTSGPPDRIVPVFRGRLAPEIDPSYLGRGLTTAALTFDLGQGLGTEGTGNPGGPPGGGEPEPPCGGALILNLSTDGGVVWNFYEGSFDGHQQHSFSAGVHTINVPLLLDDVPFSMDFHLGAYFWTDVGGLTPGVQYQVQADLSFGPWFDNFSYDIGIFQPGAGGPGIMPPDPGNTTSGTFFCRGTPAYGGGTVFRVAVGWNFLAYFTIHGHTTFTAENILFSGPCV